MKKTPVNSEVYNQYGDRWYTAFDDPVALLRAESNLKTPWICETIELHKTGQNQSDPKKILDIGCGGGFLSNALAEKGYVLTGVDLSEESLKVARRHDRTESVNYLNADAYSLPFADESFDVVTAMDFLEHVEEPEKVIQEISRVLKPNGQFFFHTFNRNWISYLVIIKAVEWLVQNTPKNMHVLRLFLKPSEVQAYCKKSKMQVQEVKGIRPVFASIPLKSLFTGVVPQQMRFKFCKSLKLSYMGFALKQ